MIEVCNNSLGFVKMPKGYILASDGALYFWVRDSDGVESVGSWDKWAAYRGAKKDKELITLKQLEKIIKEYIK